VIFDPKQRFETAEEMVLALERGASRPIWESTASGDVIGVGDERRHGAVEPPNAARKAGIQEGRHQGRRVSTRKKVLKVDMGIMVSERHSGRGPGKEAHDCSTAS
jgi:hypothetical protein